MPARMICPCHCPRATLPTSDAPQIASIAAPPPDCPGIEGPPLQLKKLTKSISLSPSLSLYSNTTKAYNTAERPATAQPEKTPKSAQSTQPPSPTYSAWGSSLHGSHSPLVRPLSAGHFHRTETILEISRGAIATPGRDRKSPQATSAAPLIEAIQSELRKFKQQD